MKCIDLKGLSCPIPVLEVKKAIGENPDGIECVVDTFAAKENISRFAKNKGYMVDVIQKGNEWILKIHR